MGSDDELSDSEEEILVYVEFEGVVDSNIFSEEQLQLDMIGIDTEHPIMQINGRFYEGTYEDICGTCMFFVRDDDSVVNDPVFDATSNLRYFAKTRKSLKMQRIFIKSRTEFLGDSEHNECIPNLDTLKQAGVPLRYHEQALSFWKTMRNNRLNALHKYLEKQRIRQEKRSQGIQLESESDEDNPFAMYKDREESNSVSKSEGIQTELEKESRYSDNQLHSKIVEPETDCQNSVTEFMALEPQSPVSNDEDYSSTRLVATCKTKPSRKNVSRIKRKIRQTSCRHKMLPSDTKKKESSAMETQLEDLDTHNVTDESGRKSEERKVITVGESNVEINQINSIDNKIVKQRKREAKMKEISDQLKAIAEKYVNVNMD
ncbi:uncharacterized protein LOC143177785 [Calliopsis andreniformis]|uniref:uncharacterized protein LOC143177785 n=1 Tax=Calliopsis andreniformis TaxID=337506 RepID=UPI003FCE38BA